MSKLPENAVDNDARIRHLTGPLARACSDEHVFLVDGDRTLSPDDTSRIFLRRAGGDPRVIKQRFERDGYCFAAFRFHAEHHINLGQEIFARLVPEIAAEVQVHDGAVEFLTAAKARARVFVVSAGIPAIWRAILDIHGLDDVGVIGGIDPVDPFVFGRSEKGTVTRLFLDARCTVIGVGDSDVDAELLGLAHHAVVVVNHRQNVDLIPHLVAHPSLWQVAPHGQSHANIPVLAFPDVANLARNSH
ncbi:MAG: haloacid dehalogenase-like hydrolase [Myxococcales bacterium]|nr:haloacid dehalogenase-like hydrolase [Myxococcales bacterium]MCB9754478.1 haloacid dehalogenase-like hydrolase [Myxococcales bacterium]